GHFDDLDLEKLTVFNRPVLNYFMALGKPAWTAVRNRISELFAKDNPVIRDEAEERSAILNPISEVQMQMPLRISDYTDFYSSIEHATNVGKMFRDPEKALLPNWRHIPVGYHGRKSSIVLSGSEIHRPKGQTKPDNAEFPVFGPSEMLDFELEMAFITGKSTDLGNSISVQEAEDSIFGLVLFNDLSARDIQKWEYVPLGPFLSKSFGSVISPWVVTLDALEPFRVKGPSQDPKPLPYLSFSGNKNYDINLEVLIQPLNKKPGRVCLSNFKYMYWNMCQQLAHQSVNGCNINVGDIYGSGTISGPDPDSFGSMLELTPNGSKPLVMPDGTERRFLEDNDTVIMKGWAEKDGVRVGFGDCMTKILPAK
ncbi:MAG: fumarylacetoacetase, partial [Bacteroidetes bacterium]|nr:fumarylacetoacetase [Bacteroidota bacterium]